MLPLKTSRDLNKVEDFELRVALSKETLLSKFGPTDYSKKNRSTYSVTEED